MTYEPNFSISFISTTTGKLIHDAGTSDKKTPKGAAKNWMNNCGHIISQFFAIETDIKVIVRPIECKADSINMISHVNADKYIARERRHGATVMDLVLGDSWGFDIWE